MKQSQFEKNGGYFIDGVAYMDCKITRTVKECQYGLKYL